MRGLAAWVAGLPDPVAWAVLGFILNFIPYIGALIVEVAMFMVGLVTFPTLTHALLAPLLFLALATLGGTFHHAQHHRPPADAQPAHRLLVAGVLDLAVGSGRRVSSGAVVDYGVGRDRSSLSRG